MDEAKFNNLCSHYKDTYEVHRSTIKQRDTLFYGLLLILAVFTLQLSSTDTVANIVGGYVNKTTGIKFGKDVDFISTTLWFALLGFSTRYFQVVVEIERQYGYMHALEEELNLHYKNSVVFTREGKSYLNKYPIFSNWVWLLYTVLFPVLVLVCAYARISNEIGHAENFNINIYIDFVCYLVVGTSTVLYMIRIHESTIANITKCCKGWLAALRRP